MREILKKPSHILVVGGGAAGLMAARELLRQKHIVTILEANNRLGGRIHTIRDPWFERPIEKGVEFIHGNLPITLQLLKEGGIQYTPVKGAMTRLVGGEWHTQDDFTMGWDELMIRMNEIRQDTTLDQFLSDHFAADKYEALRNSVLRFAEGFDLADSSNASVLALREEWMEEGKQYRIPGGYDQLVNHLEKQCREMGCIITTSAIVTDIDWKRQDVSVFTKSGDVHNGNKVILTLSLGLLQDETNAIRIRPALGAHLSAATKIGFGTVVKIMLQFKSRFWEEKKRNIGFLFTNEIIPTWWTQRPSSYALLTGWAGGPQARTVKNRTDEEILELAMASLSHAFKKPVSELKQLLTASLVANWANDLFTKGAYSYGKLHSNEAKKLFEIPVEDTIYFAGEAFYSGPSPGTVEAALVSGRNVADRIRATG